MVGSDGADCASIIEAGPSFFHKSDRGELRIWVPAPKVMVYKYKGHSDLSHVQFVERTFDEVFGADPEHVHLFVDTEDQTGYDAEFRRAIGIWAKRIHVHADTYCLLVRSRIIAIGISVVAAVLGLGQRQELGNRLAVVSDPEAFRARLEATVRKARARAA